MNIEMIVKHFQGHDFSLIVSKDARWIDQKCTPDVVSFMSDCILNLEDIDEDYEFSVSDVWQSEYFNKNVQFIFGKPNPNNQSAASEYDKFINQPLKMLSYAKILNCYKLGNTNYFSINNNELLNFISAKDINAYNFMVIYIEKVLADSGLLNMFNSFFDKCNQNVESSSDFDDLKVRYENFILDNTPINNRVEIRRIYTKVLNPLAVKNSSKGTIRGRLSPRKIQYIDLMYNSINWRDVLKDKRMTRQEYDELIVENVDMDAYDKYLTAKAITQIKRKHLVSEIHDELSVGDATHVHHIFMKTEFPNLSHFYENLIRLTPSQHLTKAHPMNRTAVINKDYQLKCLLKKLEHIENGINLNDDFYNLNDFVFVLNNGLMLGLESGLTVSEVRNILVQKYS